MKQVAFGVILNVNGLGFQALQEPETIKPFCREAEALGLDGIWVNDIGRGVDPFAILGLVAGLTERVTLGTSVLLLPLWHPVSIARGAATIDRISGGRFILGVGVGGDRPADFAAYNIALGERGARSEEALDIVEKLWQGGPASHEGLYFQLSNVELTVKPVQARLPVWVGGRMGGKGVYRDAALKRTARRGDGWFPYQMAPAQFATSLERLEGYSTESRRSSDQITKALSLAIVIDNDPAVARATAIHWLSVMYNVDFSPYVDTNVITGTPAMCISRIQEYVDAGAEHLVFNWACAPQDVRRSMRVLAEEILPALKTARP